MLEELALQYSEIPDDQVRALSYGFVILGGIIGGVTDRSVTEIMRATYFALSGLIFLCVSAVTFIGMDLIVQSIIGGFFWIIIGLEMLASMFGGFFLARISAARSRDAYGHGRMGALGFIPIANLWATTERLEERGIGQPRADDPPTDRRPWRRFRFRLAYRGHEPFELCAGRRDTPR
ncbi:hypothetical protein [Breoghania sp. L-A4]|uniref:hypothetical protein n=1 Tax=Breoghania sp. L-A4 TaxID=2304600 RepID=UPI0013C2FC5C|nr:hypothetical protein [Breoghania sp. L-A4]